MPLLCARLCALLIAGIALALTTAGCGTFETTVSGTSKGKFGLHTLTPAKDFQTLGMVFTQAESGAFTYQALLKEAQKLGADAIINVVIERKGQGNYLSLSSNATWYGSALAVKYTTTLTQSVTVAADGRTTTTSVYLNEDSGGDVVNIGAPAGSSSSSASSESSHTGR